MSAFMKRFWLVLFALFLIPAVGLHAQAAPKVKTIPVQSKAANVVLSPDDHTVAVYNNYLIYNDPATPDLVPVTLYDTSTGEQVGTLSGYTDWVTGLDFNSDGSQIVTFHRNGDVNLWNTADQTLIKTIATYGMGGSWVQFLPDDHSILYRAGELVIGILDLDTGAITQLFGFHLDTYDDFTTNYVQFPARGDITVAAGAVSPDGLWLVTSTANDAVDLWDVFGGGYSQLRAPSEQPAQFSIRAFAFSGDGSQLIYFDNADDQTHVWDVNNQTETLVLPFGGVAFGVNGDATKVAWADRQSSAIYVADIAEGAEPLQVLALPDDMQVAPPITNVAFSSDGSQLVVGGLVGSDDASNIYVIDLAS